MEEVETGCWQDLPPDVVRSVAQRLSGVDDFLRLGAVCRPWSGALAGFRPVLTSPHFPWLVPTDKQTSKEEVPMYSPNNRRVNRFPVPAGCSTRVVGCHHGWLVTVDEDDDSLDVHVFNPVTGDRAASLPSFSTLTIRVRVKKVALSSTPHPSGVVAAAAAVYCSENADSIAFAKAGDGAWSGSVRLPFLVADVIYCCGSFFVVGTEGRYEIIDPSTGPEPRLAAAAARRIPPMFPYDDFYRSRGRYCFRFVLSPSSGHLLVVMKSAAGRVVVIKYDPGEGSPSSSSSSSSSSRWVETKDLGDEALFLGAGHAMSLPAGNGSSGSTSIRRNCVYFSYGNGTDAVVTMFDVEKGRFQPPPLLEQGSSMRPWNKAESWSVCWFQPSLS